MAKKMTFPDSFALLSYRIIPTFLAKRNLLYVIKRKFNMDSKEEDKSTMEIVNIPPIVTTYRQALNTFDPRFKKQLPLNLAILKDMMNRLKADDLGFDQSLNNPETWNKPDKAPCTYIEVFQNSLVNMCIFVLKPGFKLPLHDHPHMFGLLKVIAGAVKIRSFTEYQPKHYDTPIDHAIIQAKQEASRINQAVPKRRRLFAKISQNHVCNANSVTNILTPTSCNYHEIEALSMPAAFFDILSPPYDTLIENIGPRKCTYYLVSSELTTDIVELQETKSPECFYCDQVPYLGPLLV